MEDGEAVVESVGYLSFDPPEQPAPEDRPVGAYYISNSRIGEIRPRPDTGSDDDDTAASSSSDEDDDTDWSDSDDEAHQPQRPAEGIGPVQDSIWNARFQQLVRLPDTESKYQQLAYLAHDFQHAAEVYGRIIISERFVPVEFKTIKPLDIGGIAGGEKFIVQSILFKYALDTDVMPGLWMYGGDFPDDASAMKAAGHELRSLARLEDSGAIEEGIFLPLETLVDYRGFRLLAVSVLPVSRKTICYGSHDAGLTVHSDYPAFNRKLKAIFTRLNLKGHRVKKKILYGPGDIEGHWGADGKLYLLDFSRLYPPESIQQTQALFPTNPMASRALFYKMLRPELVSSYQKPLCSDAFSLWLKGDPLAKEHNDEVRAATTRLIEGIIPDLALEIVFRCLKLKDDALNETETVQVLHTHLQHILHRMHTCGVNMRFLGALRSRFLVTAKQYDLHLMGHIDTVYSSLMFTEMAARVAKNMIRALLREKMKQLKVPSSEPYRQLVLNLFNLFSGQAAASTRFWTSVVPPTLDPTSAPVKSDGEAGQQPNSAEGRNVEYYIYHQCLGLKNEPAPATTSLPVGSSHTNMLDPKSHSKGVIFTQWLSSEALDVTKNGQAAVPKELNSILDDPLPMKCAIRAKFGLKALSPDEWESNNRNKPSLYQGLFFKRVCDMMGIVMANQPAIFEELNAHSRAGQPNKFEFLDPHLLDLAVHVKHMHLVASCEGMTLWLKAAQHIEEKIFLTDEEVKKCELLLIFAREKFEFALRSITDSVQTLAHLAKVENFLAVYWKNLNHSQQFSDINVNMSVDAGQMRRSWFELSTRHYEQALNILQKKQQTMNFKQLRSKQQEQVRSMLFKVMCEMSNAHCEWSIALHSDLVTTTPPPNERKKSWERAWDLIQEVLIRSPQKLWHQFESDVMQLLEGHLSVLYHVRKNCRLFNYVKAGRVGIVISHIIRINSLRIVEERMQRGKYTTGGGGNGGSQGRLPSADEGKARDRRAHRTLRVRAAAAAAATQSVPPPTAPVTIVVEQAAPTPVPRQPAEEVQIRTEVNSLFGYDTDPAGDAPLPTESGPAGSATTTTTTTTMTGSGSGGSHHLADETEEMAGKRKGSKSKKVKELKDSKDKEKKKKKKKSSKGDKKAKAKAEEGPAAADAAACDNAHNYPTLYSPGAGRSSPPPPSPLSSGGGGSGGSTSSLECASSGGGSGESSAAESAEGKEGGGGSSSSRGIKKGRSSPLITSKEIKEGRARKKAEIFRPFTRSSSRSKPEEPDITILHQPVADAAAAAAMLESQEEETGRPATSPPAEQREGAPSGDGGADDADPGELKRTRKPALPFHRKASLVTPAARPRELDNNNNSESGSVRADPDDAGGAGGGGGDAAQISGAMNFRRRPSDMSVLRSGRPQAELPPPLERSDDGSLFALKFAHQSLFASARSYPALAAPPAMTLDAMKAEERKRGTVAYWLGKETFLVAPGTTKYLCAALDGSLYSSAMLCREAVWMVDAYQGRKAEPSTPGSGGAGSAQIILRSVYGKLLSLVDQKGATSATSCRLSDAAKWEFEEVPAAPDSFYLKSLLNNKWLHVHSKKVVAGTAQPTKAEWGLKLANANRVYIRGAKHGKYLRAIPRENDTTLDKKASSGGASREARAVAFTASYVYDPWWIERHPQDTQRVCLRAFDGSFLATCGKSSSGEDEEVRLVEGSPSWWYVRYLREEVLGTFESEDDETDDERPKTVQDTRIGLTMALSPYPLVDKHGRETPERRFLCTDSRGEVVVSTAWQSTPAGAPPLSPQHQQQQPHGGSAVEGSDHRWCREWVVRWFEPRWAAVLALLEAELLDMRANISRAALLPAPAPSPDASHGSGMSSASASSSAPGSGSGSSAGQPGAAGVGATNGPVPMVAQLQTLLHAMCDKSQYSVTL